MYGHYPSIFQMPVKAAAMQNYSEKKLHTLASGI
jgi:hypothetical protein